MLTVKYLITRQHLAIHLGIEHSRLISLIPQLLFSMIHHIALVQLRCCEKLPQNACWTLPDSEYVEVSKRYTSAAPSTSQKPSQTHRKRPDMSLWNAGLRENVRRRKHVVVDVHSFHWIEDIDHLFVSVQKRYLVIKSGRLGFECLGVVISFGRTWSRWRIKRRLTTLWEIGERSYPGTCDGWFMESMESGYTPAPRWGTK